MDPPAERGDVELLGAWRGGDRGAGNEFVARHFAAVYRFLRRRATDPVAAKDLAQRTFLAVLESPSEREPARRMRAYLLGIAYHLVLRAYREAARREGQPEPDDDSVLSPSRAVEVAQRRSLLRTALQSLPLEFRATLELHYWDDLTTAEIAELLGIAQGTVKWRLSRGREMLRQAIAEQAPDPVARDTTLGQLERLAAAAPKGEDEP